MPLLQIDFTKVPVWLIIIALCTFIILLVVALKTGREVNFWGIKIGGNAQKNNDDPV